MYVLLVLDLFVTKGIAGIYICTWVKVDASTRLLYGKSIIPNPGLEPGSPA